MDRFGLEETDAALGPRVVMESPGDRSVNRGGLNIVSGPPPRKRRCSGDGPSVAVPVSLVGPSAWGPVDDSGPAGPSGRYGPYSRAKRTSYSVCKRCR